MQQTTMHLNPSSTFPFLRSTGMTARHSNPKAKEKKKFLFDPFLFIHVWTTWMLSVKNSLIGSSERASTRKKKFNIQRHLSFPAVLLKMSSPFFWFPYKAGGGSLKCTREKPRPKSTPFGAYQRNKRWRRRENRRGWWSCVIEPRDEFDGDGSIQSLNKKTGRKGRIKRRGQRDRIQKGFFSGS